MTSDPQLQAVLDQLPQRPVDGATPIAALTPQVARERPSLASAVHVVWSRHPLWRLTPSFPAPIDKVEHRTIPSIAGREIALRLYTPRGARAPYPVLIYFHGGGFVIGDLDRNDATCRALANRTYALVVAVGYHQAPEFPFPAAPEDAFAAYRWVLAHAGELGGDPALVAVGGEGAGGNLATVTALLARDRGVPLPLHQLLVYPLLDCCYETPSYRHYHDALPWNTSLIRWCWAHYLASEEDAANPYAVPLRATDLRGLPPTTIIAAEIDPVRSDGEMYAQRLREAGVPVKYHYCKGMTHEFFGMSAVVEKAHQAVGMAARDLEDRIIAVTGS